MSPVSAPALPRGCSERLFRVFDGLPCPLLPGFLWGRPHRCPWGDTAQPPTCPKQKPRWAWGCGSPVPGPASAQGGVQNKQEPKEPASRARCCGLRFRAGRGGPVWLAPKFCGLLKGHCAGQQAGRWRLGLWSKNTAFGLSLNFFMCLGFPTYARRLWRGEIPALASRAGVFLGRAGG